MDFSKETDFNKVYSMRDDYFYNEIKEMMQKEDVSLEIMLQHYMSFVPGRQVRQTLAYYEIFKEIMCLPGSIAEVGVFMGNGLFTWAKLQEIFFPNNRGKKVFGFDNFAGYTKETSSVDEKAVEYIARRWKKTEQEVFKAERSVLERLVHINSLDNLIMGINRVFLYCNDNLNLEENIKLFLEERGGIRLSLLVIDVNLYHPTCVALENLYDKLVHNGLILFRGYGSEPWEGESKAVDEFISKHKEELEVRKTYPFSMYPLIILRRV